MYKLIVLLFGFILLSTVSSAQYSVNKTKYDHKTYVFQPGDPYNPTVAGVASLFVPGLGQMLSGEGGRGAGFLAGYAACYVVSYVGATNAINNISTGGDGSTGSGLMLVGLGGAIGVGIWSIVDAVKVAKVNNLAFRDQNKTSMNLRIEPYFDQIKMQNNTSSVSTGLSFKITF